MLYHSRNFVHALQVFNNLGFVRWFHTGEKTSTSTGHFLFSNWEVIKFTPRVRFSSSIFFFSEDTNTSVK